MSVAKNKNHTQQTQNIAVFKLSLYCPKIPCRPSLHLQKRYCISSLYLSTTGYEGSNSDIAGVTQVLKTMKNLSAKTMINHICLCKLDIIAGLEHNFQDLEFKKSFLSGRLIFPYGPNLFNQLVSTIITYLYLSTLLI